MADKFLEDVKALRKTLRKAGPASRKSLATWTAIEKAYERASKSREKNDREKQAKKVVYLADYRK